MNDFTLIIPAKGECPYIFDTLESIVKSTLLPDQILLIDDGLEINTRVKCFDFSKSLPLTIIDNEGTGLVNALNTGINNSYSKYVARLDADDRIFKNRFELQLNYMTMHPDVIALGGQVEYIDFDGNTLGHSDYPEGRIDNLPEFEKSCLVAHPSMFIRTKELIKIGGYRKVFTYGSTDLVEDFDLWLRLKELGQIHNLSNVVVFYRQHNEQLSSKNLLEQNLATKLISFFYTLPDTAFKFNEITVQLDKTKTLFSFLLLNRKHLSSLEYIKFFVLILIYLLHKKLNLSPRLYNFISRKINI
jgi:glycosyltransferase involved in cell wall biosynthesis